MAEYSIPHFIRIGLKPAHRKPPANSQTIANLAKRKPPGCANTRAADIEHSPPTTIGAVYPFRIAHPPRKGKDNIMAADSSTSPHNFSDRCIAFGNRLRTLRLLKNLSQADLAEQLHLSPTCINRYERGMREPSFDVLYEIADFFGVDFNYLLCMPNELSQKEDIDLIQKFRALDDRGRSAVFNTLEYEYNYISQK